MTARAHLPLALAGLALAVALNERRHRLARERERQQLLRAIRMRVEERADADDALEQAREKVDEAEAAVVAVPTAVLGRGWMMRDGILVHDVRHLTPEDVVR